MGLNPGDLIDDKYRIVRLIGEGGMGAVYEGENNRIHRRVAIKVLHATVAGMADVVARFEREAQAAGRIGSEHIVEVLDLGTLSSGDRYMVMEFMDGDSLSERIRQRGRLQPSELYPIARQLLEALAAAHKAGIVHRDLKPDNVFLLRSRRSQPDFVKLLDFGISKFGGGANALSMTRTGTVMGTPYYMAPEQAKGARDVDHRVDIYAIGVILYEAVAGQVPFLADTFNELLFKIVLEKPQPLQELAPDTDPAFIAIIDKAMARDPAARHQSALELQQALEQWAAQAGQGAQVSGPQADTASRTTATRLAASSSGALAATPGAWTGASGTHTVSEPAPSVPKQSRAGLVAALAAMVVVAGGSGVFMLLSGKAPATAGSSLASSGPSGSSVTAPSALPPAPAAKPSVAEPQAPEVAVSPTPIATAPSAARPKAIAPRAAPPAPRPAAPRAPPPKAEQPSAPGGRKIRQTL
jgi:serine/threonine-protein kinase